MTGGISYYKYSNWTQGEEPKADIIERELLFSRDGGARMRTVRHVLFTSWPNYGVVDDVTRLPQLVKRVNKSSTAMLCCLLDGFWSSASLYVLYGFMLDLE